MKRLLNRVRFALKYKTLQKTAIDPANSNFIFVIHKGNLTRLKRRCPHQGAPLETAYFEGDDLVCPWHGCRFKVGKA